MQSHSLLQAIRHRKLNCPQNEFAEKAFLTMHNQTSAVREKEKLLLDATQLKHLLRSIGFDRTTKAVAKEFIAEFDYEGTGMINLEDFKRVHLYNTLKYDSFESRIAKIFKRLDAYSRSYVTADQLVALVVAEEKSISELAVKKKVLEIFERSKTQYSDAISLQELLNFLN